MTVMCVLTINMGEGATAPSPPAFYASALKWPRVVCVGGALFFGLHVFSVLWT